MELEKIFPSEKRALARAMYLPLTKQERLEYQNRIGDLVKIYQPKIEQKTNIDLGKVEIKPYLKDLNSCFTKVHRKTYESVLEKFESPSLSQKALAKIMTNLSGGIIYPFFFLGGLWRNSVIDLGAGDDCVRIPSGFNTRINLWGEKYFEKDLELDSNVVHELSHILWNRIENEHKDVQKNIIKYRKWVEGFATFCAQEHFLDIYPNEIKSGKNNHGVYAIGKEQIKKIVEKYGPSTLLQIPKKWEEFEIEIASEVSKK